MHSAFLIFGIILIFAPFLLMNRFDDKKRGFCFILFFVILLHLATAFITQALHVFSYVVVAGVHTIVFLLVAFRADLKNGIKKLRAIPAGIDWVLVGVMAIAGISLFSVHYNYSGEYVVSNSPRNVAAENLQYAYPYYSDEWYAVAFIKDSIKSRSLPIDNPFTPDEDSFINLELPFHSFLSEIFLLTGIDPLTRYTVISIFAGLLTVALAYVLLLLNNVGRLPAAIAAVSILYITNGANLPGVWNLLPQNLGIIAMLLGLSFISMRALGMAAFAAFTTLVFYPPLVVLYVPALLVFIFSSGVLSTRERKMGAAYALLAVAASGMLVSTFYFLSRGSTGGFFEYILFSKIFYQSFTPDAIPRYAAYDVIPPPVLLLAVPGAVLFFRKAPWLFAATAVGIAYWVLYSFATFRLIIEYQRVVFASSILITAASGFGIDYVAGLAERRLRFPRKKLFLQCVQAGTLALFLVFSFFYTERDNWKNLVLVKRGTGDMFFPRPQANTFLHPDDLRLFENIRRSNFLTIPWKGTVIGTATGNYPVAVKAGTITMNPVLPTVFRDADCAQKSDIAAAHGVSYVYMPEFYCNDFIAIGASAEGLFLYQFSPEGI